VNTLAELIEEAGLNRDEAYILSEYVFGPPTLVGDRVFYPMNKEMPDKGWAMVPDPHAMDGDPPNEVWYNLKSYRYLQIINRVPVLHVMNFANMEPVEMVGPEGDES